MSILSTEQLLSLGFKSIGDNVRISDKARIYGAENIRIGNNVRIDDFVVLSAGEGGIEIGNYIHIAVFSSLIGAGKITLSDFCNISSRVSIYSSSDDFSGEFMTNPMVPVKYTNVTKAPVFIGKHVIIGCSSVILPNVSLGNGVAIGAQSLVNTSCQDCAIYAGAPIRKIKPRKAYFLKLENEIINGLTK